MRNDYTPSSVILDRTGSMESIHDDTIGGFNAFLNEQKAAPGYATMTLVQFDSQDPYEVLQRFATVSAVPVRAPLYPRASTPLFDAWDSGINDLEQSLLHNAGSGASGTSSWSSSPTARKTPAASSARQIARMIKEKQAKLDWQFVFLSADLGAITNSAGGGCAAGPRWPSTRISRARVLPGLRQRHVSAAVWSSGSNSPEEDRAEQSNEKARR